jgi:hypothetical protein
MSPPLPFLQQLLASSTCEADGFPLVEIGHDTYCSVEYADGLIGGQRVVGVAQEGEVVRLLFAGGYSLPLTCPCCGGPLHLKPRSLAEVRALLIGRTLEGFRHGEWVGRGNPPVRHPVFALQFSGTEERAERTLELSLDAVRGIRKERISAAG